jgi:hypothetical protein
MTTYQYEPLPQGTPSIRLLILEPGGWNAPIHCQLQCEALNSNPAYEALSYVWGEPKDLRPIHIHGLLHQIQPNLDVALRYLRHEDKPRALWIDALCINQEDLDERSDQVQQMYLIYQQATLILSWLGESSADSGEGLQLLEKLGRWTIDYGDTILYEESEDITPAFSKDLLPYMARTGLPTETQNWQALFGILRREYWSRMWIIQELAAGGYLSTSRGLIICGEDQVDRIFCDKACSMLLFLILHADVYKLETDDYHEPMKSSIIYGHPPALRMFESLKTCVTSGGRHHFQNLMMASRAFEASDPRDKIYALLGLACEEDRPVLPDYSRSTDDLLRDVVKFYVNKSGTLQILEGNRYQLNPLGPSWTPDLSPRSHGEIMERDQPWKPAGNMPLDVQFHENKMIIQAVMVGKVVEVIGPMRHPGQALPLGANDAQQIADTLGHDMILLQLKAISTTLDGPRAEAFWRTLIVNRDLSSLGSVISPAPASLGLQHRVLFGQASPAKDFMPDHPRIDRILSFTSTYEKCMLMSLYNRCFFTTESGHMGVGSYAVSPGDVVAIFPSASSCFVVRKAGECYSLVGDAYVHGVMMGELFEDGSSVKWEGIELI